MCGFLGKISNVDFDINELNEPNQNIICRGPDNTQTLKFTQENPNVFCSLVFNRLSILDLSENANQPMSSLQSESILMFNGEIYNNKELRKDLESKGIKFKTSHKVWKKKDFHPRYIKIAIKNFEKFKINKINKKKYTLINIL